MNEKPKPEKLALPLIEKPMTPSELEAYADRISEILATTPARYWVPPKIHNYDEEEGNEETL